MQCKIAVPMPFQQLLSWGESPLPLKKPHCHIKKIQPHPLSILREVSPKQQWSSFPLSPVWLHRSHRGPGTLLSLRRPTLGWWCWISGWWHWVNMLGQGWKEQGYHIGPEVKKWCLSRFSQLRWCSQAGPLLQEQQTWGVALSFACILLQQSSGRACCHPACRALQLQLFPCSVPLSVCSSVYLGKADWNQKFTIPCSSPSATATQIKR